MPNWPSSISHIDTIAQDTIAVHLQKPADFSYKPGQTITLNLPAGNDGSPALRHTFSLTSAPHEEDLSIATRVRQTPYKQALKKLDKGSELSFTGPYGKFGLPEQTGRPIVMVAGGIGITPYISMLHDATHNGSTQQFLLLYSNHHPQQAAFLHDLQELTRLNPYFRLQATMTGEAGDGWTGLRGRIDKNMLQQAIQGLSEPLCYVTGTPYMVEEVLDHLNSLGIADDSIRSEGFHGY